MTTITTAITTGSTSSTAATTIQPPVYKTEEYTIAGIVLKFLEEKVKDIAKGLGYTAFWVGQAIPDAPPQVRSFSTLMGNFKNFVSATEVPKKSSELWEALTGKEGLWTNLTSKVKGHADSTWGKVGTAAGEVFKKTTSLTNSVVDGIDLTSNFVAIDAKVMTWLKGFNFAATLGGAGYGAVEQVQKFAATDKDEVHKQRLYLINLARDVSYAVLGAMGLFFVVTATPIVPWMIVACLTSGLTLTLGGYFYEKVYDPEGKGKNLDPDIVIKNNIARREYESRLANA